MAPCLAGVSLVSAPCLAGVSLVSVPCLAGISLAGVSLAGVSAPRLDTALGLVQARFTCPLPSRSPLALVPPLLAVTSPGCGPLSPSPFSASSPLFWCRCLLPAQLRPPCSCLPLWCYSSRCCSLPCLQLPFVALFLLFCLAGPLPLLLILPSSAPGSRAISSSSVSLSTTARSPSSDSAPTHLPRCPSPLLSALLCLQQLRSLL